MQSTTTDSVDETVAVAMETLEVIELKRNHPLYVHPSDTLGSILTTIRLIGSENYSLWSRSMLINLRAKSKIGFVLGSCKRSDYASDLEEQWEKCNAFVLAWIMNTVLKELLSGIVYASDAATVWADLKERFDKVDGSRIYQLHREICTIHQGLSETYGHARSQILMMYPLPSVGKAYAMIVSDESQRITSGTRMGGDMLENIALFAGKGGYNPAHNRTDGDKVESPMYPNVGEL